MKPRDRVLSALSRKELDRPPVGVVTQSATIDQMDAVKVYWPDAHTDPKKMATLGAAAHKVFGLETARIPFDLTIEAEFFGAKVDMGKQDRTPMVKEPAFTSESDVVIPKELGGRCKVVVEATKELKKMVGNELPVVVGVTGPLTLAGAWVEAGNLLLWMITEPDTVHKFIKAAAEFERFYIGEIVKAGADVIVINDPSASTDMLSADMFDVFATPYTKTAIEHVGDAKTILHICGNTTVLLDHMINTGVSGLSIEEKVVPEEAVNIVNNRAALVGNVGSVMPLFQGTPDDAAAAATRCKNAGFNVVAPGCGLPARTPKANIQAMVDAIVNG